MRLAGKRRLFNYNFKDFILRKNKMLYDLPTNNRFPSAFSATLRGEFARNCFPAVSGGTAEDGKENNYV